MSINKESKGTMEMFLTRSLEKVLKECTKKQARLKESCTTTLELIQKSGVSSNSSKREDIEQVDKVLNKLIITLKLACESRVAGIMSNSLDCLQKLMAYGYIRPSIKDMESAERKLMDKVIEIIGDCFDFPDDNVQLQILKAFLTAVSNVNCDIHEQALMNAVRACFNIYLVSRSRVNQTTAKATLNQMLQIIYQRFELASNFATEEKKRLTEVSAVTPLSEKKEENSVENKDTPSDNLPAPDATEETEQPVPEPTEEKKEIEEPEKSEDKEPAQSVVSELRVESIDSEQPAIIQGNGNTNKIITGQVALNIAYTDCYLIFRALCKLSTKELPPSASGDSVDMKRKLLALELLQCIVDNAGSNLKKNERFINNAIKKYLSISLLLNGVSAHLQIFKVSLNIFKGLIKNFQEYLKNEIGVFFSKILLRMLSSTNSSIEHKKQVIKWLLHISKEGQILVDIFLNYDCHLESVDVFESIVNHLSAISKLPIHNTTSSLTGYPPSPVIQLEYSIRLLALQSLVTIMQSLVQWSNELTDDPNQHVPGNVNNSNGNINLPPTTSTGNAAINLEDPPNSDAAPSHNVNNVRTTDDQLTKQKQLKQQIEHGKKLFNYKPKKGIDYLIKIGHIPHTSKDVAKFLKTTEGLPVAKIGEYIGEIGNPFCKSVLYDYIDLQRFDNLPIYQAVRNFLYNFRLPGESEKIDVIMEKFAERYYNDNKHNFQLHREDSGESNEFIFANADAVYIFSFHLIMLATDLHSRAIKKEKKYSLHDWVKNNAGLNDGKDYPEKFLVSVYESIASTPLKTREDNDVAPNPTNNDLLNGKQRQILFNRESKLMLEKSQELILDKLEKKSIFFTSKNIDHVKPMFELCWCPMLAAFSMNLEISQDADEEIYSLCLSGFQAAIRVSSIFYLETERNAFVTSLSQFTLLSNFREMKKKNIEAIKCLIKIAHDNGNYLGDSWMQVLHCISQLAKIAGIGGPSSNFFPNPAPMPHSVSSDHHQTTPVSFTSSNNSNHSHAPSSHHHHPTASRQTSVSKEIENSNAISVNFHIDLSAIDKIFANTVHLNDNAIVEFVTCLCAVSDTEVNHPEPRPFSLQKLIEIAYYNMERIRFVWSRIWGIMATHFKKVACHASLQIAMYAVDSLRQLAMKFLEKDELANYHFQKDFLKPFEHIIHFNRNLTIRELVIHCLSQMILARSENIKSGWKSIFMVFTLVGNESDESIVFLAFDMLSKILEKYFHLISFTFFVECVNCLVAFSKNIHFKETSIKAIKLLGNCADQLASGNVLPLEDILVTSDNSSMIIFTDNENHLRYWFPILTGLSEVISHPHIDVRTHALDTLFNILKKYGTLYNADLWELLFRGVLLPIFDNVKHFGEGSLKEDNEWLTSTCLNALTHFIELFSFFFDKIHFLTNDYLALLTNFILQENHHLAIIGSTCFLQFIITNVQKWTKAMWKTICISFYYILTQNRCTELLSIGESKAKLIQKVEGAERFSFSEISPAELEKLVAFPVFTKTESEQTATPTPVEEATVSDPPTGSESPPTADPIEQKLVRATPGKYRPFDVNVITGKINVQLQLLSALSEITTNYLSLLENDHLLIIFKSLETTYTFALETNNKIQVWQATGKSGIMPLIIKQENLSMAIHLQILFKLYGSENEDKVNLVENRLIYWVSHLIKDYLRVEDAFAEYPKLYISAKLPIILRALQGFSQIEDQQFLKHLKQFYPSFSELVLVNEKEVRQTVKTLLVRLGNLKQFV